MTHRFDCVKFVVEASREIARGEAELTAGGRCGRYDPSGKRDSCAALIERMIIPSRPT